MPEDYIKLADAKVRFGTATGEDGKVEVLFDIGGVVCAMPVDEAERMESALHLAIARARERQAMLDKAEN